MYEGRSKSSRPDLVMFGIIGLLKYYLLLIAARLRTWHAQYDFWAINISCILAYEHDVCQMVSRMLTSNCAQVSEELLKRQLHDAAKIYFTTCYSDEMCIHHFDSESEKQSMQWNERIRQNCHFITLHNSVFFCVECKLPITPKMHKIFIAQKTYCACRLLSLATKRSKHYFNFILNRTIGQAENFSIAPRMTTWEKFSCSWKFEWF